jgi:hypothetical protein
MADRQRGEVRVGGEIAGGPHFFDQQSQHFPVLVLLTQ